MTWNSWFTLALASLIGIMVAACVPLAADLDSAPTAETTQPATTAVETHVNADWSNVQSRTEDGLATLGNPDAPVTFIDYSDFM